MSELLSAAFCFEPDTLSGKDVASILEETWFFEPTRIMTDKFNRLGGKFKPAHLKRIAGASVLRVVLLETDAPYGDGPSLSLGNVEAFQSLYLNFWNVQPIPLPLLHKLACHEGFRLGYCHSAQDTFWQGETQIDFYKSNGRPYEHLLTVWNEDFSRWDIDVSSNPARRQWTSKFSLQAAWRMWYGKSVQKLIPNDLLFSFPDAASISALPCGTVYMQLFDDPLAFGEAENRRRQQAFRDYVGLDAVVEKCNNETNPDACFEHREGHFAYGGSQRFIRWIDDMDRTVLKSRATRKEIWEHAEGGDLLKHWVEPKRDSSNSE